MMTTGELTAPKVDESKETMSFSDILLQTSKLLHKIQKQDASFYELERPSLMCLKDAFLHLAEGRNWSLDQSGQAYLAQKGLDTHKWSMKLESAKYPKPIERKAVVEAPVPQKEILRSKMSFEEYLGFQREESLRNIMDRHKKKERRRWTEEHEASLKKRWEEQRKSWFLSIKYPALVSTSTHFPTHLSAEGERKRTSLASIMVDWNEARLKKANFPICHRLSKCESVKFFGDLFKLIGIVAEESRIIENCLDIRQVQQERMTATGSNRASFVIDRSLHYLEKIFIDFMDKIIAQFPKEALLGGKVSLSEKVRAFCSVKLGRQMDMNLEVIDGQPIWACAYYYLRCGDIRGLDLFVTQHEHIFYRLDRHFISIVKAYIRDRNLPLDMLAALRKEIELVKRLDARSDPYKALTYGILGSFKFDDLFISTSVITTVEDWLWLQLKLLQPPDLESFQSHIVSLGPDYFLQGSRTPLNYVRVLLECGLYNDALVYLLHQESYKVEAVHVGLCMAYYGLLDLSPSPDTIDLHAMDLKTLLSSSFQLKTLLFAPVVCDYASSFPVNDREILAPLNYLVLIASLSPSHSYQWKAIDALRQWICKCKPEFYSSILGSGGILASYEDLIDLHAAITHCHEAVPNQSFVPLIAYLSAIKSEAVGHHLEAITLYHIGGHYDNVLFLLCQVLSDSLLDPFFNSNQVYPYVQQAQGILKYYQSTAMEARVLLASQNLISLLSLYEVFEAYEKQDTSKVLDKVDQYSLIQFHSDANLTLAFWKDKLLSKLLPKLLEFLARSIYDLFLTRKKKSTFHTALVIEQQLSELKKKMRFLILLTSRLPFLSSEIPALMTSLEAKMF